MITILALSAAFAQQVAPSIAAAEHCIAMTSLAAKGQVISGAKLAKEVVLVPDKLMPEDVKALAFSLHAEAEQLGDTWRIERSPKAEAEVRKLDSEFLKQEIKATIDRNDSLAKNYEKVPELAPISVLRLAMARRESSPTPLLDTSVPQALEATPCARLLVDLFRSLPERVVDAATPGDRTAFSNSPMGIELPLDVDPKLLTAYVENQKKYSAWVDKALSKAEIPPTYRWAFRSTPFVSGKRTFLLWIDRCGPKVNFGLQVFNSLGALEADAVLTPNGPGLGDKSVTQSPSHLGLVKLPATTLARIAESDPNDPTFRSDSLDPVANEPMDVCLRDVMCLWAQAKGFDRIVACLPDGLMKRLPSWIDGSTVNLDAVTNALAQEDCETLVEGTTLVVRPVDPLLEEATRLDRKPLSSLMQKAKRGQIGLTDILQYHVAYARSYEYCPLVRILQKPIVQVFSLHSPNWGISHDLLVTLGMLTPKERESLASGMRIQVPLKVPLSCLFYPAFFATPTNSPTVTDLERSPFRLLNKPCFVQGFSSDTETFIRRVSKGYAEIKRSDPATGKFHLDKGENLVFDKDFVTIPYATSGFMQATPPAEIYQELGSKFRFWWAEERTIPIQLLFGSVAASAKSIVRERVRESKGPVEIGEVPNFKLR